MLINPGFAQMKGEAQVFYAERKIHELHQMIRERGADTRVILDGRISAEQITTFGMSGEADIFVAGSTCLKTADLAGSLKRLKELENQIQRRRGEQYGVL